MIYPLGLVAQARRGRWSGGRSAGPARSRRASPPVRKLFCRDPGRAWNIRPPAFRSTLAPRQRQALEPGQAV